MITRNVSTEKSRYNAPDEPDAKTNTVHSELISTHTPSMRAECFFVLINNFFS